LVFKIQIPSDVTEEEIEERYKRLYPDKKYDPSKVKEYELELGDISEFMKCLQERFAKYYNRKHNRYGHVWAGRFESNILADEEAVLNCLAYLDLNGVKAKRERQPEDDPYSTIGMTVNRQELKNRKNFTLLELDIDHIIKLMSEVNIPNTEAKLNARFGSKLEYLGEDRKAGFIKYMAFVRMKYEHGFYGALGLFTKRGFIIGKKQSIENIAPKLKYKDKDTLKFYDHNTDSDDTITLAR